MIQISTKRLFDFLLSFFGLIISGLIIFVAWIIASIETKSNGFFIQKRVGKNGKLFNLYKIKTMRKVIGVETTITLKNDVRITRSGKFFRDTKIDELPQLWNVLKGEMSLVGPRPLLMEYLPLYSPEQARRHEVKPGITGWAQVNGRNAISWEDKFQLDVWYVDHQSLLLDLKILFLTIKLVFQRHGISAAGEVTMPRFTVRR